jgi:hypothetical protein
MARTLNAILRKRRGGPTAGPTATAVSSEQQPPQPQDTRMRKRKSELERWLFSGTKKSKGSSGAPSLVIIESSSDDESERISARDESERISARDESSSSSCEKPSESETQLPTPCEKMRSLSAPPAARVPAVPAAAAAASHAKEGTSQKDAIEIDDDEEDEEEEEVNATGIEIKDGDDVSRDMPVPMPSPVPSSNYNIPVERDRTYAVPHYHAGMVKCGEELHLSPCHICL